MQGKHQKRRVRILVKTFPQPSTRHEETVCLTVLGEALPWYDGSASAHVHRDWALAVGG